MAVRISVDVGLCQGYGNCVIASPTAFDLDDEGIVMVLNETAPESDRPEIEAAARSCPVDAIILSME